MILTFVFVAVAVAVVQVFGDCPCTKELFRTCGVDGVTYNNPCLASCYSEIDHYGECETSKLKRRDERPPCACPDNYSPVCGKDGKTYANACEAACEGVEIDYNGKCPESDLLRALKRRSKRPSRSCACHLDYTPVCGEDGKTYPNACTAECEGTEVKYDGECDQYKKMLALKRRDSTPCICPLIWSPVCGNDGNSYDNACSARCENVVRMRPGRCSEVCEDLVCDKAHKSVCIDGVRYANKCVADCLDHPSTFGEPSPDSACSPDKY